VEGRYGLSAYTGFLSNLPRPAVHAVIPNHRRGITVFNIFFKILEPKNKKIKLNHSSKNHQNLDYFFVD